MEGEFYIRSQELVLGPFDLFQMREWARSGKVRPEHPLSRDGERWFSAAEVWNELLPRPEPAIAEDDPEFESPRVPPPPGVFNEYSSSWFGIARTTVLCASIICFVLAALIFAAIRSAPTSYERPGVLAVYIDSAIPTLFWAMVLSLLVSECLFLIWIYEIQRTLRKLGSIGPSFGPVHGVILCALPFLDILTAPVALSQLWKTAHAKLPRAWKWQPTYGLLPVWVVLRLCVLGCISLFTVGPGLSNIHFVKMAFFICYGVSLLIEVGFIMGLQRSVNNKCDAIWMRTDEQMPVSKS